MKYLFLNIIIICVFVQNCIAQYTISDFKKFTAENGLSDNLVNSIVQDDRGFIWTATSNGLNRFDGHRFDVFRSSSGLISSNNIRWLKKFSGNKIGVLSSKGLTVIDASLIKARAYTIADSTTLWFEKNQISDVAEIPDMGYVFTGATGFYAVNYDGKLLKEYQHYTLKDKEGGLRRIFFGNNIFSVTNNDYLLYYLDTQLGYYDATKNSFELRNENIYRQWRDFLVPEDHWTIKKQINKHEYLHLSFHTNTLTYHNHKTKAKTFLKLPFTSHNYFYWDSYINFINDSVFAINCHRNGFFLFTLSRNNNRLSINPSLQLPGVECFDIFSDKDERLWIATAGGLLMEKKEKPATAWQYTFSDEQNDAEYFNTSVYKYKEKIFVGRFAWNNGLLVYDDVTDKLVKRINFFGGNNRFNGITSLQQYHPDTLWISTENGLLWLNTINYTYGHLSLPENIKNELIEFFPVNKQGYAWMLNHFTNQVASYHIAERKLKVYHPGVEGLTGIKPKFICYDSYGDVWIAGNGLCRFNQSTGKFDPPIKKFSGKYPLEDRIGYLIADNNGSLWLGTVDNGILQYHIKEKKWTAISESGGLPSDIVGTFSPYINSGFWFGSSSSLYRLNNNGDKITITTGGVQLPQSNITSEENHYYFDSASGNMYFAVRNYLAKFPVSSSATVKVPPVLVKEVVLNNGQHIYFPGDTISLNHKQNRLAIYPGIVDYNNNIYEFQYSINQSAPLGLSVQNPVILFDRLQPGEHRIVISVKGTAEQPKIIYIIIKPPFWKTWWFYTLIASLSALLFYYLYRQRIKNIRNKAMLNQRLAEFEMKALHAQMNPHFIFNCLNSIKGLIITDRGKEASEYLTKFSSLVRQNLDHSRQPFVSLKDNIEYIRKYIEIEKLRFEQLQYEIKTDVSESTEEINIAPMLLQPLVENAIWHGLTSAVKEKKLSLAFTRKGKTVRCIIADNGIGINESKKQQQNVHSKSVGLKNVEERITLLNQKFGLDYSLTITDLKETAPGKNGTEVILQFTIN